MSREELIKTTLENLKQLSDTKIQEVSDYVSFLSSKIDEKIILEGIKEITSNTKPYIILQDEEELYQVSDIIEKYK